MDRRLLRVRACQRGEDFRVFLQTLHRRYRGWQIMLVLDPDRVHPASASQYLAAQFDIELLCLAPRCPARNPLEALWRSGTQTICANRQCQTIDWMVERFLVYRYWLVPREARRKAGPLLHPCASPMCEICSASLLKTFAKYLGVD
jgi:hypothetical protein